MGGAWYLLGYLVVGWVLFAIALTPPSPARLLSLTLAGLPVLLAAAAAISWCANVERARLRPMVDGPVAGRVPPGHRAPASWPGSAPGGATPPLWRDVAYLFGLFVPLLALDFIGLAVWLVLPRRDHAARLVLGAAADIRHGVR